jgi:hypothetical protein
MSELFNYSPDLKQRKIGVRESFESKCTYLTVSTRNLQEMHCSFDVDMYVCISILIFQMSFLSV